MVVTRLAVYLTLLFNMCMWSGHLPQDLLCSVFVPLIKNKTGDFSDVNNYRVIAISNSCSKVLELTMYDYFKAVQSEGLDDDHQFGFKKSHSTGLCTHVFKSSVDYYVNRGSHVFCCFVDFSKAIDYVDYWLLFHKLFTSYSDLKMHLMVRLLATWYSYQTVFVRWKNVNSRVFHVLTGVQQGGVLSPYLFHFYVQHMIWQVTQMKMGCNVRGAMVNLLCFADDMVLLAPSWSALKSLIDVLFTAADKINMKFNTKKTVCMVFNHKVSRKIVANNFPAFTAGDEKLKFVDRFKYLGSISTKDLKDDDDIERELKCLFTICNVLTSRFKCCSWTHGMSS